MSGNIEMLWDTSEGEGMIAGLRCSSPGRGNAPWQSRRRAGNGVAIVP